jgi:hypothetical protein
VRAAVRRGGDAGFTQPCGHCSGAITCLGTPVVRGAHEGDPADRPRIAPRRANEMMNCMANLVQAMAGPDVVSATHTWSCASHRRGRSATVRRGGGTELIVFPYMLSPGKHCTGDIPRMVAEAAAPFPDVAVRVTSAFGATRSLARSSSAGRGCPSRTRSRAEKRRGAGTRRSPGTACGDACRCHPVSEPSRPHEPISPTDVRPPQPDRAMTIVSATELVPR